MRLIDIIRKYSLLDWKTILVGFKRNWITKDEVIEFAVNQLSTTNEDDYNVSLLAGSDNESNENILNLIHKYIESKNIQLNEGNEIKKWLLAHLILINEGDISDQDKLNKLQEIYSEFEYPEEMAKCSIYYTEPNKEFKKGEYLSDPLDEMKNLINILMSEFT